MALPTAGNPHIGCHDNFFITNGSNGTFRYNEVTNWHVEGFLFQAGTASSTNRSIWYIYGNIFHDPATDSFPRLLESQVTPNTVYFYHNTIVNMPRATVYCSGVTNSGSWAAGTIATNNLYYGNNFADCGLPAGGYSYSDKPLSEAHGQGNAPDPFANYSARSVAGYNLRAHTNAGSNLGSTYNTDYNGNTRVNWDRGFVDLSVPVVRK